MSTFIAEQNIIINHNKIWFNKVDYQIKDVNNREQIRYNYNLSYYDSDEEEYVDYHISGDNKYNIYSYPPELKDIENVKGVRIDMFLDSQENLWVNNLGFLTLKNEDYLWNSLIFSPVFVERDNLAWEFDYKYSRIFPKFQIENKIWFFSNRSISTLDIKNGDWCKISNMVNKNFYQDDEGIYIFFDNAIYKVK